MHKEYKHIVESSDKAVLFIHGIVGTPNHFEDFVNLMPKEISVYNLLLDGHGKGVRDFSKASMEKWENQVADAVKELEEHHKEVYVVAHSLGCLLAMEQSVAHSKISKMFLLAVPLKLFLKPRMISTSLKVYFNKVHPEDERTIAAKRCCGIEHSKNPFLYLGWVPRFLELFYKIGKTRKIVNQITVPCEVYQSRQDEMVSQGAKKILEKNPVFSVMELKNSGHYYYDKKDFLLLQEAFEKWIEE